MDTTPLPPAQAYAWLDLLPLPTAVVRAGVCAWVNEALCRLLEVPRDQLVGQPFERHLAPEERERMLERYRRRMRGEPVPDSYEVTVALADGRRRTAELFSSRAGEDTLYQVYDITARSTRHENLRALARLGALLQRELSEEAVFRVAVAGLTELGAMVARLVPAEGGMQIAQGDQALGDWSRELRPTWTPEVRKAWDDGYVFMDDAADAAGRFVGPEVEATVRAGILERALNAAMIRFEVRGLPAGLLMIAAPWMRPEDQPTLRLFGSQISAALDAALAVRELSRRNAELTALNKVATAAGVAGNLEELFAQASAEVARVTGCTAVALYLVQDGVANLAWQYGGSAEAGRLFARVPLAGTRLGEVVDTGTPRIWRRTDYDEVRQQAMRRMQQEVVVSVPMISRSRVIGVVNSAHAVDRTVSPQEVELLSAMAAHLTAAVDASRLVEDLRRRNDELSKAQAQLVQRERLAALGELAAAVAHEVRNPLAVIFNLLTTLKRASPSGAEDLLRMLTEESERIDHLVNDLLDLARPSSPSMADVALPQLIQESLNSLRDAAQGVRLEVVGTQPERVRVDPRLMRQVFVNLATNAVQAMPNGGVLCVRLEQVELPGGPWARVTFEDTGEGVPEHVMPRIFEPFYTTRARGTGLGLTLVKRFIEAHRGTVSARNLPAGAALTVEWPLTH